MLFYKKLKKLAVFICILLAVFMTDNGVSLLFLDVALLTTIFIFSLCQYFTYVKPVSMASHFYISNPSPLPSSGKSAGTIDLVVVIDENNINCINAIKNALIHLAKQKYDEQITRIGIVGFGNSAHLLHPLQEITLETIPLYLHEMEQPSLLHGGNNLQAGVHLGRILLNQSTAQQRILLMLTDGNSFWWLNEQEKPVTKAYLCQENVFSNSNLDAVAARHRKGGIASIQCTDFEQFRQLHGEKMISWNENEAELENLLAGTLTGSQGYTNYDWKNKKKYPYLAIEKGTFMASQELRDAVEEGIQMICVGDYSTLTDKATVLHQIQKLFLDWTAQIGQLYRCQPASQDAACYKSLEKALEAAIRSLYVQ